MRLGWTPLGLLSFRYFLAQCLLCLQPLREIPRDFSKADQFAGIVAHGGDHHTRPKPGPIFADTPAFIGFLTSALTIFRDERFRFGCGFLTG